MTIFSRNIERNNVRNVASSITALLVGINLFSKVPKSLHIDESLQYQYTTMALDGVIQGSYVQNQPPLGNLIQHFFGILFDPTNFTLRVPSIFFAILISVLMQKILSRYIHLFQSVLLTLLIFFNPLVFTYSRYSRSYALTLFLIMLLIFLTLGFGKKISSLLPFITCLIPWSRTVEGATATVLFWLLMLAIRGKEFSLKKRFIWSALVATSLATSLKFSLSTGENYKSDLDIMDIFKRLIERTKMVLELGDGNLSSIDFVAAFLILISLFVFALTKKRELFWLYFTYVLFAIGSPVLILSTSSIPLFPRYIFFYSVIYTINLFLALYFVLRKSQLVLTFVLILALFLSTINVHNLTRAPFPPFFEAAKYIESNPEKNVAAFLPGEFNKFMAAWPAQPGIVIGTDWISKFVRDGGKTPEDLLIFPFVNPSYEVVGTELPKNGVTKYVENLGGGLGVISIREDTYTKLSQLSELDFHGSELWLKLLGLRISSAKGNSDEVTKWLEQICEFADVSLSPGALFGDFSSPEISLDQFLLKNVLPNCRER
jgi:hypothetical protein